MSILDFRTRWLIQCVPVLAQHAAPLMLPHVPNYTLVFVNVT